jgi:hypothetical protein
MTREREVHVLNGWWALLGTIAIFAAGAGLLTKFVFAAIEAVNANQVPNFWWVVGGVIVVGLGRFHLFRLLHAATQRGSGAGLVRGLPRHGSS